MKAYAQILKIGFMMILLVILYGFALMKYQSDSVRDVEIRVDPTAKYNFLNERRILNYLDQDRSIPIFGYRARMPLHLIEKKLDENTFVNKAQVYISPDSKLVIEIEEKNPIARVETGKDGYYLSDEGKRMELSPHYSAELPLIYGAIEESDWPGIKQLIIEVNADKLLKSAIIGVEKRHDKSFILFTSYGSYKIVVGRLTDIQNKLKKFERFYHQYLKYQESSDYEVIDLRFNNQIVVKKNKL